MKALFLTLTLCLAFGSSVQLNPLVERDGTIPELTQGAAPALRDAMRSTMPPMSTNSEPSVDDLLNATPGFARLPPAQQEIARQMAANASPEHLRASMERIQRMTAAEREQAAEETARVVAQIASLSPEHTFRPCPIPTPEEAMWESACFLQSLVRRRPYPLVERDGTIPELTQGAALAPVASTPALRQVLVNALSHTFMRDDFVPAAVSKHWLATVRTHRSQFHSTPLTTAFDPETDKGAHITISNGDASVSGLGSVRISPWVSRSGSARVRLRVRGDNLAIGLVAEGARSWDGCVWPKANFPSEAASTRLMRRLVCGTHHSPGEAWAYHVRDGKLFHDGAWDRHGRRLPRCECAGYVTPRDGHLEVELRDGALHYIVDGQAQGAVFQIPEGGGRVALALHLGHCSTATLLPDA